MDYLALIRSARQAVDEARDAFHRAIADAVRDGTPVNDVAAESGYHRNHVARIARARGVGDQRHRSRKGVDERRAAQ